MAFPKVGSKAPAFTLLNQNEEKISLKDFLGKNVVVYFYPRAMTPGCTVQACGIRDFHQEFAKVKTEVLAISPDTPKKLLSFEDKKGLNFTLLSDPDHKIADKYGAWGPKQFMGKKFDGILRTTFIINKEGKLVHVMDKVNTKTHHEDALAFIKANL